MNESERAELARLKAQQERLESEMGVLSKQLSSFEERINRGIDSEIATPPRAPAVSPGSGAPPSNVSPLPSTLRSQTPEPLAVPPIIPASTGVRVVGDSDRKQRVESLGSAPSGIDRPQIQVPPAAPVEPPTLRLRTEPLRELRPLPSAPPPRQQPASPEPKASFEMRLGTFWLVRIGVVMVLTGLVFFGNLAYQNYISRLGPAGKVFLLYAASALLLVAGWRWQRKAVKEALRNYAQVLFAGGLAALYFTTYAAHHLPRLQIIQSAQLDGVLLLACAGFMIWAAERKRSEVLAFFAVGLAYYTSIITRVGYFTLWSNLVLSAAAVFFLVRNRWAGLSFGSLAATYLGYAVWRFFDGTNWRWASPEEGLWSGACFLVLYWLVFTCAVFLSRHDRLSGANRAAFLTFNNGAFFSLFLLTMVQVQQGGFWKFSLIDGAVLLGVAVLARRLLPQEPLAANSYLTQGLLLVTVGFISKFAGLQLALILATESVLLLVMGYQRKNLVLVTAAYIAAALAVGWGMDGLKPFDAPGIWLGAGLGVLMMVNVCLTHRNLASGQRNAIAESDLVLRPQPSYFTVLALVIWLVTTWNNTSHANFPLVVGAEALVLTFSIYLLRVGEVSLLSQGLMLVAQGAWLANWPAESSALPWWNPVLLIAMSLGLSHWWPRQNVVHPKTPNAIVWPALYALAINLLLFLWLAPRESNPSWLLTTSLLAVGLTAYGVFTRAWFVALCGQLFTAVAVVQFGWQLWQAKPPMGFPLAPIAALALLSFGTVRWFQRWPQADTRLRDTLLQLSLLYRWVALAQSIIWICTYVPARERIWLLALLGLWCFFWSGLRRNPEALLFSAAFTATALGLFWLPLLQAPTVYFPNLIAILVLLTQRQLARRMPERYPQDQAIHGAVIAIGGVSLWLFVSRWVLEMASGFYLTASWSVLALALFTAGLLLRERMYRWIGLGILACALGRVVFFDVWKLETVYRILSFMALGIVLLVLGFIYSKYQEKIKEWL